MDNTFKTIREFKPTTASLKNKTTVFILILILITGGLISYKSLAKALFPEIVMPTIYVSTQYPGNSPLDIENLITRPLEREINTIKGIKSTIVVASGKGGVGKSTVAVNIAASLSTKYQVGLLDLDIYGPSLPLLVGIDKQPQMTKNNKLIPLEKFNMKLMSFGFIN